MFWCSVGNSPAPPTTFPEASYTRSAAVIGETLTTNNTNLTNQPKDGRGKPRRMQILLEDDPYAIIGACFGVDDDKGSGFLEAVYQECLKIELELPGSPSCGEPGNLVRFVRFVRFVVNSS
jgi:hypothetical protein